MQKKTYLSLFSIILMITAFVLRPRSEEKPERYTIEYSPEKKELYVEDDYIYEPSPVDKYIQSESAKSNLSATQSATSSSLILPRDLQR